MSQKKQQGFGAVGILALVALVCILTITGLYVFKTGKKQQDSSNAQTNEITPKESLKISEWGILIDQPSSTKDLVYVMQSPDADGVQRLHFSYKGLAELDSECQPEKTLDIYGLSNLGTLARFTPTSKINLPGGEKKTITETENDPNTASALDRYKKVGENYYYLAFGYSGGTCGESREANAFLGQLGSDALISFTDPKFQESIRLDR